MVTNDTEEDEINTETNNTFIHKERNAKQKETNGRKKITKERNKDRTKARNRKNRKERKKDRKKDN